MALLNLRLTAEDEKAVRVLKGAHVELSSVIREALHREADKLRARSRRKVSTLIDEIFSEFPEPGAPAPRDFDVHDRREFAAAMRAHLAQKRGARRRSQ